MKGLDDPNGAIAYANATAMRSIEGWIQGLKRRRHGGRESGRHGPVRGVKEHQGA